MTEQYQNFGETTLAEDLDDSEVTVTVTAGSVFPATGNYRVVVDDEIMLVTARSTNDLTVTRGAESTTAAAHTNGADILLVLTAASLSNIVHENRKGTSFPGSPATNDQYRRTDIRGGMDFTYDGTRWLSDIEFSLEHNTFPTVAADINAPMAIPHDYKIWITAVDMLTYQGASATWVMALQYTRFDESSYPQIWSRSTSGHTTLRWYGYTDAVGVEIDGTGGNSSTNPTGLWWNIDEQTGTATLYISLVARYKLIAT